MKMRINIFIVLLLVSIKSLAQDTLEYLHLNNGQVYYERVFNVEGKSENEISVMLREFIPGIASIAEFKQDESGITARFSDAEIPLKKYGLTHMTSSYLISSPFVGNIDIQVKDGKYKVKVSGVYFDSKMSLNIGGVEGKIDGTLEDVVYIKRKDMIAKDGKKYREGKAFESFMSDIFDYNNYNSQDNW